MTWYAKQNDAWAQVLNPYVKSGSAWSTVNEGWVKDAGIWKRYYLRDMTAPSPAQMTADEVSNGFQIQVTVPAASNAVQLDLRGEVTVGSFDDLDNTFWELQDVSAGQVVDYTWVVPVEPGNSYRMEARLLSSTGVSSAVTIVTKTIPPAVNYYQAYIEPINSDSWVGGANGGWKADTNQVIQGGVNELHRGCWFYGDRLDRLMGNTVTKMEIQIHRIDSDHGVTGDAIVRLGHHDNKTKPNDAPWIRDETRVGTLKRGERKWFTVPTGWYSQYKNSNLNYRGYGLQTSDLGENSPNYIRTPEDGVDTNNGRLYVEYHD